MAKQPMGRGSCWGRNQGEERMAMILRGAGCQPGPRSVPIVEHTVTAKWVQCCASRRGG